MYNANKPEQSELPSTAQLLRSTLLALIAAIIILVTVILPSEYAVDPTGAGRLLGLTEMGEIKEQLAQEAEADRQMQQQEKVAATETLNNRTAKSDVVPAVKVAAEKAWRDELRIDLTPGQGAEIKLVMDQGGTAVYSWISEGGPVNFDLHGDGSGRSISYEKGRGVPDDKGELVAEFNGNHGWFFRNRNKTDVTVVLSTGGEYSTIKRVL